MDKDKFTKEGEDPFRIKLSEQWEQAKKDRYALSHVESLIGSVRGALEDNNALLNRLTTRFISANDNLKEENRALRERIEHLETVTEEDAGVIGKLQSDLLAAVERLDRLADWANKQRGVEK